MAGSAFLAHYCANCRSAEMSFLLAGSTRDPKAAGLADAYGICRRCQRGTLFILMPTAELMKQRNLALPHNIEGDVHPWYQVLMAYPSKTEAAAPDHTPDTVKPAYIDALRALDAGLWTPAGVMARKTIDVATKALNSNTKKGSPLRDRIDDLRAKGLITEAMRVMAHVVRLDGNDAAHEEDPFTEDDAKEICEFARLFLTLTFTVNGNASAAAAKHPNLVKNFQQHAGSQAAPSAVTSAL